MQNRSEKEVEWRKDAKKKKSKPKPKKTESSGLGTAEDQDMNHQDNDNDSKKADAEGEEAVGVMKIDPTKPLDEQLINSDWLAELPKSVHVVRGATKGLPEKVNKSKSNHVVVIDACDTAEVIVVQNQRFSSLYFVNCVNCKFQVLDSAVIATRTARVIDCVNCQFVFETIDLRKCEVFGAVDCEFVYMNEPALLEPSRIIWRDGCYNNKVTVGDLQGFFLYKVGWTIVSTTPAPDTTTSPPSPRKKQEIKNESEKKEKEKEKEEEDEKEESTTNDYWITCFDELQKVTHVKLAERCGEGEGERWRLTPQGREEMARLIPMVSPCLPGEEELDSCYQEFHRDFVAEHQARKKKEKEEARKKKKEEKEANKKNKKKNKKKMNKNEKEKQENEKEKVSLRLPHKAELLAALWALEANPPKLSEKQLLRAYDEERNEYEEDEETVKRKAKEIAAMIRGARYCVVYSGAGISTSADIPDFRGPQGIWTQQARGEFGGSNKAAKVGIAMPTYAHYAITELTRRHLVNFVISTNMDGLHLRSGLSPHLLMEQHGNSYKEICEKCKMTYMRDYRVTDWVMNMREHYTTRMCDYCYDGKLMDTIVHFSEKFRGEHDLAISLQQSAKPDLVLVLGTSMNVQPNAVYTSRVFKNPEGRMIVVNLQKTPYDRMCAVRVYARTDNFMKALMEALGIDRGGEDDFDRSYDAMVEWQRVERQRAMEKEQKEKEKERGGGEKDGNCIVQ